MPDVGTTRTRDSTVTSDVTEVLDKVADVIEGLAAKNATMKDGPPEGEDQGGGRAPTATEERTQAYEKYKNDVSEIFDRFTGPDGTITDPVGFALASGQALADLGVAVGPEAFQLFSDFIGNIGALVPGG